MALYLCITDIKGLSLGPLFCIPTLVEYRLLNNSTAQHASHSFAPPHCGNHRRWTWLCPGDCRILWNVYWISALQRPVHYPCSPEEHSQDDQYVSSGRATYLANSVLQATVLLKTLLRLISSATTARSLPRPLYRFPRVRTLTCKYLPHGCTKPD